MGRLLPTAFIVLAIAIITGIVIPYGWYMGMMLMIGATMSMVLLYLVVDGFIRLGRANDDRWWTSLPQLTGPALGVVGLLFTAVYQQRDIDEKASSRHLAAANLKVSQAQFLSSLPGLLQSDAVRREAGLFMVELLDARLGAVFASSFAVRDSEQNVRLSAKDILENLTLSPDPDTARIARQGLEQYQRHVSKEIIGDLADAKGKLRSGLYTDAYESYQSVTRKLTSDLLQKLDFARYREAQILYQSDQKELQQLAAELMDRVLAEGLSEYAGGRK